MRSRFVKVEDMDFVTGLDEVIADTYDEPPPRNVLEKFWRWIVSALIPFFLARCCIVLLFCVYSFRWTHVASIENKHNSCTIDRERKDCECGCERGRFWEGKSY